MSNDEVLRRAAALMREQVNSSSSHLGRWSPDVVLAVAQWLEIEADVYGVDVAPQAVGVAEAYLGLRNHVLTVSGISKDTRDKYKVVLDRLGTGVDAGDE